MFKRTELLHYLSMLFCCFFLVEATGQSDGKQQTYNCSEINWTIQIPKGWDITVKNQMASEEDYQSTQELMENATGDEVVMKGIKYLIFFQKDQNNNFISTLEKADFDSFEDWKANVYLEEKGLVHTLESQDLKVDTTGSMVDIDGVPFRKMDIMLSTKKGQPVMRQEYYGTYMDGYVFGTGLSYNNGQTQAILREAWLNSIFTINNKG